MQDETREGSGVKRTADNVFFLPSSASPGASLSFSSPPQRSVFTRVQSSRARLALPPFSPSGTAPSSVPLSRRD